MVTIGIFVFTHYKSENNDQNTVKVLNKEKFWFVLPQSIYRPNLTPILILSSFKTLKKWINNFGVIFVKYVI